MHTETTWGLWSDDQLVRAVAAGQADAYAVLRERHMPGLRAVADRLAGSPTASARAVDDVLSRGLSTLASGRPLGMPVRTYFLSDLSGPSPDVTGRPDPVVAAYRSLPERSQALLWYSEVEGLSARAIAPVLGMTPSVADAMVDRARAALRQAYVPLAVPPLSEDCTRVRSTLRSYVRGTLDPQDADLVDEHLAACASCRTQVLPTDVAPAMRDHVAPTVLGARPGVLAALSGVGFGGPVGQLVLDGPEPLTLAADASREDVAPVEAAAPAAAEPRPERAPVALAPSVSRADAWPAPARDVPAGMLAVGGIGALLAAAVGVVAALGTTLPGVVGVDTSSAAALPVTADGGSALSSRAAFPPAGGTAPPTSFLPEVFPSLVPPLAPLPADPGAVLSPAPAGQTDVQDAVRRPAASTPAPTRVPAGTAQSTVPVPRPGPLAPVPTVPAAPAPVRPAPQQPAPQPPAPQPPAPQPPAPEPPAPPAPQPPDPQPPAPEPPAPPAPQPPDPQPPAPELPGPEVPGPDVPAPEVPAPELPVPEPPAPQPPFVDPDVEDDDRPGVANGRGRDRDEGRGRGNRDRDRD